MARSLLVGWQLRAAAEGRTQLLEVLSRQGTVGERGTDKAAVVDGQSHAAVGKTLAEPVPRGLLGLRTLALQQQDAGA